MPYVKQDQRNLIDKEINSLIDKLNPLLANKDLGLSKNGMLNYIITRIIDGVAIGSEIRYDAINNAVGVLECAKLELYRRIAAGYEDLKIEDNGDAYRKR